MQFRRVAYWGLVVVCIAIGVGMRYARTNDVDVPNWMFPVGLGIAALAIYVGIREGRARRRSRSGQD